MITFWKIFAGVLIGMGVASTIPFDSDGARLIPLVIIGCVILCIITLVEASNNY